MDSGQTLDTYNRVADRYARERSGTLFERRWLDRMIAHAPGRRVLDLGCGPGHPIATYLTDRKASVTGVDGAPAMLALFDRALPASDTVLADMRGLQLGRRFDMILAWNSFFHLTGSDQRAMFPVFAAHAAPRAVLMFTSGPNAGEAMGTAGGAPVYHASLAPDEYLSLLGANRFDLLRHEPEDPECNGHTVWLARFTGG